MRAAGRRAVSYPVAAAILVIATVALGLAAYMVAAKFMHTGTRASAYAVLMQDSFSGGRQDVLVSVEVTSYSDAPLRLEKVVAFVTLANGTMEAATISASPGASAAAGPASATLEIGGLAQATVAPRGSQTFEVAIAAPAGDPVASVAFYLVFEAPGNSTVAVSVPAVKVPS